MSDTPNVIQALAAVMGELPAIGKDARSPEGYQYRGIEAITKHLQPLLAKHGVIIVPRAHVVSQTAAAAMKEGWTDTHLQVDWRIYGPDGNYIEACTVGIGRDKSDKGTNKAQTQAYKYLLLHMLSIADKADDSDGQTYEHERAVTRRAPREQAPSTLWDRVKATKTQAPDAYAQLKAFEQEQGITISADTIAADPKLAEQLEAILKEHNQ